MQRSFLYHTTLDVIDTILDNKCVLIYGLNKGLKPPQLKPRHHSEHDILVGFRFSALAVASLSIIDCYTAVQLVDDSMADFFVVLRNNGDTGIFFQPVQ